MESILKSLAAALNVKSLASKPQVLENCLVLGSRTALLFELLKFCRSPEKIFEDLFQTAWKIIFKSFFLENTCRLCP